LAIAERGLANKRSYEEFHKWAISVTDSMRQAGINAFDLANEYGQRKESLQPVEHMALGAKVTYNNPYNSYYKAGGDSTLTDGVCGTWNNNDQRWQGFIRNIDLQVDLGQEKEVSSVSLSFLQILGPEIYLPAEVQMTFLAEDNSQLVEASTPMPSEQYETPYVVAPYNVELVEPVKARYINIKCPRTARMGWLFLDEIVVK
jgi:hexosaminidase